MSLIATVDLWRADLPLTTPYRLSYRTFESFEPLIIRVRDAEGREGWGEQHISPGSSAETRDGGWSFATGMAAEMPGMTTADALASVLARWQDSKVAATALTTALDMLAGHPATSPTDAAGPALVIPLLTAFNATDPDGIAEEVERRIREGFGTFKIKVGKDVDADLARVALIQRLAAGRASLRLDANRAYSREQGCRFAAALDPAGIELFEQPCDADDWDANAAVAAVSTVPLMLDEPICTLDDIDRAAGIPGVGLCKIKLKRFGSLAALDAAITRLAARGLGCVLGDGLGSEINCWMEGRLGAGRITGAGEFNGYVKLRPEARLLAHPLPVQDGAMVIPPGWLPVMDMERLTAHTVAHQAYGRR